ncbi:Catabolite repression HPr, partial [Dysosmobacter welbionis]
GKGERPNEKQGPAVCADLLCHLGPAAHLLEAAGPGGFPVCAGQPHRVVHGAHRRHPAAAAGPAGRCAGRVPGPEGVGAAGRCGLRG